MHRVSVASFGLAALLAGSPALAAIDIHNSPGAVQPEENVLLTDGTGVSVFGQTNQTHSGVTFTSLANGVSLNAFASGQARVEAVGGPLDTLTFFLTDGGTFDKVEFDLHKAVGATDNVTVSFLGTFAGGSTSRTFTLGNGNNWFSAEATDGDAISAVIFDTSGLGVGDLRQVRLGGILGSSGSPAGVVPEPASWALMLGGFGLVGGTLRARRRTIAFG